MRSLVTYSLRRIPSARFSAAGRGQRTNRRALNDTLAMNALEDRVMLSGSGGGSLLGSLAYVGVVTTPIIAPAQAERRGTRIRM